MEPWRVCRPVVADSHDFDEKPDPDPHQSEMSDPDPCQRDADPQHYILQVFLCHPSRPLSDKKTFLQDPTPSSKKCLLTNAS